MSLTCDHYWAAIGELAKEPRSSIRPLLYVLLFGWALQAGADARIRYVKLDAPAAERDGSSWGRAFASLLHPHQPRIALRSLDDVSSVALAKGEEGAPVAK